MMKIGSFIVRSKKERTDCLNNILTKLNRRQENKGSLYISKDEFYYLHELLSTLRSETSQIEKIITEELDRNENKQEKGIFFNDSIRFSPLNSETFQIEKIMTEELDRNENDQQEIFINDSINFSTNLTYDVVPSKELYQLLESLREKKTTLGETIYDLASNLIIDLNLKKDIVYLPKFSVEIEGVTFVTFVWTINLQKFIVYVYEDEFQLTISKVASQLYKVEDREKLLTFLCNLVDFLARKS